MVFMLVAASECNDDRGGWWGYYKETRNYDIVMCWTSHRALERATHDTFPCFPAFYLFPISSYVGPTGWDTINTKFPLRN